eukprot:2638106-Amphidinium_carterae.1
MSPPSLEFTEAHTPPCRLVGKDNIAKTSAPEGSKASADTEATMGVLATSAGTLSTSLASTSPGIWKAPSCKVGDDTSPKPSRLISTTSERCAHRGKRVASTQLLTALPGRPVQNRAQSSTSIYSEDPTASIGTPSSVALKSQLRDSM